MRRLQRARGLLLNGAFVRSSLTSALATASDFVTASLLHHWRAPASVATFFGCVVGGFIAFSLNRVWAFRAREGHRGTQLIRFVFVWAMSAVFNAAGVELTLLLPGLSFGLAWILVRGLVYTAWNYPMLRLFVFARAGGRLRNSA